MKNIFQAVILCGGYGSRIKKISKYRAKPLIKFFDINFIVNKKYNIKNLKFSTDQDNIQKDNQDEDHQQYEIR